MTHPDTLFLPILNDGEDKSCPLKNRIRKNYQQMRKWGQKTKTNSFRIYDRDIKEFPLAIDFYDKRFCVHYYSSSKEDDTIPERIKIPCVKALVSLFRIEERHIYWRNRIRREKMEQYEKSDDSEESFTTIEYGVTFKVNLRDYLDTGLFLDHRETRQRVAKEAQGKHLLNLFSYTGAFSVHAAVQGALSTTSVDLSNTYLAWCIDNFRLNNIPLENHSIIRCDCLQFLNQKSPKLFDLIVIDPPTLSRSKKMDQMFDIQKDYISLIKKSLPLLSLDGTLYFSTNSRRFSFEPDFFPECQIQEITQETIPLDFRNHRIHACWKIKKR